MFDPADSKRFTSTSGEAKKATDIESLVLPEERRGRVPLTRADYVLTEDPRRVAWEREVRKFLDRLSQHTGHKVTAPMIFEWATGVNLAELQIRENTTSKTWRGGARWGSANVHLRHINWVLKDYFGDPQKTTIAGRHVGRAYTVPKSYKVKLKKPANITLLPEWMDGTLRP